MSPRQKIIHYSKVAQNANTFSGGQKQRLSIARAITSNADVYIFDDSFSALDFKTDASLRQALKQNIEKTVIIVAQRVSTIIEADKIIVLDEGEIVGQGRHEDLLQTCQVYAEIVKLQMPQEVV